MEPTPQELAEAKKELKSVSKNQLISLCMQLSHTAELYMRISDELKKELDKLKKERLSEKSND